MRYFSTSNPALVSRRFDDEIVIANYQTGAYYSLTGSGAEIWLALDAGFAADEVASVLAANSPAQDEARRAVAEFVDRLAGDEIILPLEAAPPRRDWSVPAGFTYSAPSFERFDDLRDLLLLDPVHDVDEAGWPLKPDDGR